MSIRINLLPYRERKRVAARLQMYVLVASAVGVGVAIWLMTHGIMAGYISAQDARNAFMVTENEILDKKIEEIKALKAEIEALKARKGVIETLQFERASAVQIMDQLVRLTPEGIYLKTMKQTGGLVNLTGYAMSNDMVSNYMVAIAGSNFLEKPMLVEIKAAKEGERRVAEFSLSFSLVKPKVVEAAPVVGKNGLPATSPAALAPASAVKP